MVKNKEIREYLAEILQTGRLYRGNKHHQLGICGGFDGGWLMTKINVNALASIQASPDISDTKRNLVVYEDDCNHDQKFTEDELIQLTQMKVKFKSAVTSYDLQYAESYEALAANPTVKARALQKIQATDYEELYRFSQTPLASKLKEIAKDYRSGGESDSDDDLEPQTNVSNSSNVAGGQNTSACKLS